MKIVIAGIIGALLLHAIEAFGFQPNDEGHLGITEEVLRNIVVNSPHREFRFQDRAIETIRDENRRVDISDTFYASAPHFTDEEFAEGSELVKEYRERVIKEIASEQPDSWLAWYYLGKALHAIQDFYSHTNWLNNNWPGTENRLSTGGIIPDFDDDYVCGEPDELVNAGLTRLTSAYFPFPNTCTQPTGKCMHGVDLLLVPIPLDCPRGIHKDKEGRDYYPEARERAKTATREFIDGILADGRVAQNWDAVAILMGYTSIVFVVDRSGSMDGPLTTTIPEEAARALQAVMQTDEEPADYVLVTFNDPEVDTPFITTSAGDFLGKVANLRGQGGGDCPERYVSGLSAAVEVTPPNSKVYTFTDGAPNDGGGKDALIAQMQKKHIDVKENIYGSCSPVHPSIIAIAEETGGQAFILEWHEHWRFPFEVMRSDLAGESACLGRKSGSVEGLQSVEALVDPGMSRLRFIATLPITDSEWGIQESDFYQFYGTAGQSIKATIAAWVLGSRLDSVLRLYDSDAATLLAEDDDDTVAWTLDSAIDFTLPHDGPYFLEVLDHSSQWGLHSFYELTLSLEGASDYTDVGHEVEPNDVFELSNDLPIGGRVHGVIGPAMPQVALFDPTGAQVTTADPSVSVAMAIGGHLVSVVDPAPGIWRLDVLGTGGYSVTADARSALQFRNFYHSKRGGLPAHEGLQKLAEEPIGGSAALVVAELTGDYATANFRFVDRDGATIAPISLTAGDSMAAGQELVGEVLVPNEPYRVAVSGTDAAGFPYERIYPALFNRSLLEATQTDGPDVLPRSTVSTFTFSVRNRGPARTIQLSAVDEQVLSPELPTGWVSRVEPASLTLDAGASGLVEVDLTVPADESAVPGLRNDLTLYAVAVDDESVQATAFVPLTVAQCPLECELPEQCHQTVQCDEVTQVCGSTPVANGTTCDDGNPCTLSDSCQDGLCVAGLAMDCSSLTTACGVGTCDSTSGECVLATYAGDWCDDGVFCNGTDRCSDGECNIHSGDPCGGADGDANCSESCDELGRSCVAPDPDASACDDGLFCNGVDQCLAGECASHSGDPCPYTGFCDTSCSEDTDTCTAVAPDGLGCSDGVFCNGADTCIGGECGDHAGDPCSGVDGDSNCSESCDESLDNCTANDPEGSSCNDGLFCTTTDTCAIGTCIGTGDPCVGGAECANVCIEAQDACLTPAGTSCSSDDNPCTADACDGSGGCSHVASNAGVTCRPAAGVCDTHESCTGVSTECPADEFLGSTTVCRESVGSCDPPEFCTGSSASCSGEAFLPASTLCRSATDVCDAPEYCDGTAGVCPADVLVASTDTCRSSAGSCDVVEKCTGTSVACPADSWASSSTLCRAAVGVCDAEEHCSGTSAACPTDVFLSTATLCRASAGGCDVLEYCTGAPGCPADLVASSEVTCRVSAGECDVLESCDGSSVSCPEDTFKASGTSCSSDDNPCTTDICTGAAPCSHQNNDLPCDDGLFCNGSDGCSGGACSLHSGSPCTPEYSLTFVCSDQTCAESSDECRLPAEGQPCLSDGDPCTIDQCDGFGNCYQQLECITCPPVPMKACGLIGGNLTRLALSKSPGAAEKDRFVFNSMSTGFSDTVEMAALGDPAQGDSGYSLCLYSDDSLVWSALLHENGPNSSCADCWTKDNIQIQYKHLGKNPPEGIGFALLRARGVGFKTRFKGRGTGLGLPDLLALGDVRFQVLRISPTLGVRCWGDWYDGRDTFSTSRRWSAAYRH